MEELPVTMRIKEMMNEFSEKEKSIANYILNNNTQLFHIRIYKYLI